MTKAGPCLNGKLRHEWGIESCKIHGITRSIYHQPCRYCGRVRIIQYGRSSNRVTGYFTKEAKS